MIYDPLTASDEQRAAYFDPLPFAGPWQKPEKKEHRGHHVTLVPLDAERHSGALHAANSDSKDNGIWRYLPYGPFGPEDYRSWVAEMQELDDPHFYAVVPVLSGVPQGVLSIMRHDPKNGGAEVGHINYSPGLQKTAAATEAVFLTMKYILGDLGYRRFEWKCDAMNEGSRRAALRFGFSFEGIFRQAAVIKGRNRDTAWYSITDGEWPRIRSAFEEWLQPGNFDEDGAQKRPLSAMTGAGKGVTPGSRT